MKPSRKQLQKRIETCAAVSRTLDLSSDEFKNWSKELLEFADGFRSQLETLPAFFGSQAYHLDKSIREFEDAGTSFGEALKIYQTSVMGHRLNPASPRFFGYVPGGGLPVAAFADFIAATTNLYSGVYEASPGAASVESSLIEWLRHCFGFPEGAWGTLQSGGSLATLTAMMVARDRFPISLWPNFVVYSTAEVHHVMDRALRVAGLATVTRRTVSTDSDFRMQSAELRHQIEVDLKNGLLPWLIFASAGTVNTGAVDPLDEIADIAAEHNLWFHIDGAYGGAFILTEAGKNLFAGIGRADSIVMDPHKGFFQPYGIGAVLVREGKALKRAMTFGGDYLEDVQNYQSPSPSDYSPELTRHFRALRLWFTLKVHGIEPLRKGLEEKLLLARYLYDRLSEMDAIELGPEPQLSCVAFRCKGGEAATRKLHESMLHEGLIHVSSTRLRGGFFLRACILSFRSHIEHIDMMVDQLQRLMKRTT
jgi:aromatic-L-amino-acid/L-tryptophan decarboxylase